MSADLLARAAADVEAGGPVAAVLAGHEDDPGPSALALRLLGSVHRLVLERRAGALAASYPSVGGTWEPEAGWSAFRALLEEQPDDVRAWLDRAPQTNEVGRATALYGGLLHLPRDLPARLVEIGSSAGLNLRADRFAHVDAAGRRFGPTDAEVVLDPAWRGRALEPWPDLRVVERLGSDLHPVDPATTEGRLSLTAYVWPDQRARLERLRAAFRTAERHPVDVARQDARSFVEALDLVDGTTTVLWHSVMWQYLPAADQRAILSRLDLLGASATDRRRLAHLRAEPARRAEGAEHEFLVRLRLWPDGEDRVLGVTAPHGLPTTWE
jgi:hypothetical protein